MGFEAHRVLAQARAFEIVLMDLFYLSASNQIESNLEKELNTFFTTQGKEIGKWVTKITKMSFEKAHHQKTHQTATSKSSLPLWTPICFPPCQSLLARKSSYSFPLLLQSIHKGVGIVGSHSPCSCFVEHRHFLLFRDSSSQTFVFCLKFVFFFRFVNQFK